MIVQQLQMKNTMKLQEATLHDDFWRERGYVLPRFDRALLRERTLQEPCCLHLGAGNIFRAFLAVIFQELIEQGEADTGLLVAEGYDAEIIEKAYRPFDDLAIFLRLNSDKTMDKVVLGSVVGSFLMEGEAFARLLELVRAPSLQCISLTITEKAYRIREDSGNYLQVVVDDFQRDLMEVGSYIGKVVALLWTRFQAGATPIALLSLDNLANNGDRLREIVLDMAMGFLHCGKVSEDFVRWLQSAAVRFPCSMIDKITPRPSEALSEVLSEEGVEGMAVVRTQKGSFCAGFVNAERAQYLVIEDDFPNGRPALEKVGVIFTDRHTVDMVEKMKVGTCLNPLHTALAVFGMLFSIKSIAAAVKEPLLYRLLHRLAYDEGLPVVEDPKVIDPKDFLDAVLRERLPNPFIPDTPARIACDTSQKVAIRFVKTMEAWGERTQDLEAIPLIIAGWCRYLCGVDDEGRAMELSPDPLLARVGQDFAALDWGVQRAACVRDLLQDRSVFAVDLYALGVGSKIERYFYEMMKGKGAVRATLQRYL